MGTIARQRNLSGRCQSHIGDMVDFHLGEASVVFLYMPPAALTFVAHRVFSACKLRPGAAVFTADGPFSTEASQLLPRLSSKRKWLDKTEALGLHSYLWQGPSQNNTIAGDTVLCLAAEIETLISAQ